MSATFIVRSTDAEALALEAAELIARTAQLAIRQRGRFTLVLAGGATPERTYAALARQGGQATIDWSRAVVLMGDERFVPWDDARSNFGMAQRTLLAKVPIPRAQVLPIPTSEGTPAAAAEAYANQLARQFNRTFHTIPPRFDVVLLGLGEDGHTASLFPGAPALAVRDHWVTWSPPGDLPPPVDRVTMTLPVLNAARHVLILAAGERKAPAVRDVLLGGATVQRCPAAGVQPADGQLTWLVDEGAAALLSDSQGLSFASGNTVLDALERVMGNGPHGNA